MNTEISELIKSVTFQELPYEDWARIEKDEGNSWLFHLPDWTMGNGRRLTIAISSFALIIEQDLQQRTIHVHDGARHEPKNELASLIDHIENRCRASAAHRDYFYLLGLSYDYAARKLGINIKDDFYHLSEWFLILPGEGYLVDHNRQRLLHFTGTSTFGFAPNDIHISNGNELEISESRCHYLQKIEHIRRLIQMGEVYQINYSIRFSTTQKERGHDFFRRAYAGNPAPRAFYLHLPDWEMICLSPERFLYQQKKRVFTEPIKGTLPRLQNQYADAQQVHRLLHSSKNRAELNMITDLLRNDLSRVCQPGSVKVKTRRRLQSFAHVHHLISKIEGTLNNDVDFFTLVGATMPGGSISGCPKHAACRFIQELESHHRSYYTGSFFLRFPLPDITDSTILIRTALLKNGLFHYQVGGGIVYDSSAEEEFAECIAKGRSFLEPLGVSDDLLFR